MSEVRKVAILIVFIILFSGCGKKSLKEQVKNQGNSIITVLEEYKKDNTVYPPTLNKLVPDYLKKIKTPLPDSSSWEYKVSSDGSTFTMTMSFEKLDYKKEDLPRFLVYNSKMGTWFKSAR